MNANWSRDVPSQINILVMKLKFCTRFNHVWFKWRMVFVWQISFTFVCVRVFCCYQNDSVSIIFWWLIIYLNSNYSLGIEMLFAFDHVLQVIYLGWIIYYFVLDWNKLMTRVNQTENTIEFVRNCANSQAKLPFQNYTILKSFSSV